MSPMSPMSRLHVAAAQVESFYGDVDANVERHLARIAEAAERGVEVLVFPELSLTGHTAGKDALRLAQPLDGPAVRALAEAAGAMTVVFGMIEEAPAGLFYNAAVAVRDGGALLCQRKANLATYGQLDDGKYYAAGEVLAVRSLDPAWRMAVGICADLWNPALVHDAMLDGATLLCAPVSSAVEAVGQGFDNAGGWDLNLRFYAMTYGCPIVMANRTGREGGLSFWGGSRIVDAGGRVLAQAGDDETLITAMLEFADVRAARFRLPTLRDARQAAART